MNGCSNKSQVDFVKETFANLIFLPVCLNSNKFTAFFDTGASLSFLTELAAKTIGVTSYDQVGSASNNNGEVLQFKTGSLKRLELGSITLTDVTVGIFPDKAIDFGMDEEGNTFPAAMIFGWDLISQFCWSFDMCEKTVLIQPGGTMPASDTLCWNQFAIIKASYQGEEISMGFDCGHTDTMLDNTWKERIENITETVNLITGIGSEKEETVFVANELVVKISGINVLLKNIDVLERSIFGAPKEAMIGLFGADIICGRKWSIDNKSNYFAILD